MDKFDLLLDIFKALDLEVNSRIDISEITLRQDTLKSKTLIEELYRRVPNLKNFYNSSKLTCLHKNSLDKQKFPAVNMFRQILKCNNIKMEPYVISKGYNKYSGKKIVERFYRLIDLGIEPINESEEKSINKASNKLEILCGITMNKI